MFYKGDGTTTSFPFSFRYLQKKFVKVKLIYVTSSTDLVYGVDYTVEDFKVILKVAPVLDTSICIYRETPTDSEVEWVDGSTLRAYDMNKFEIQLLHIAEENTDKLLTDGMTYDGTDIAWEGNNRRIKNIEPPIHDKDVVTKVYMESVQDGFVQRNTAISNGIAEMERITIDAKITAVSSSQEALSSANVSTTKAKEATETSKAMEASATVHVANAKASENAAKVSESNASLSAQAAALSEQHAAASATAAKLSETNTATMKQDVSGMKDTVLSAKDKVAADLAASQVIQQDLATKDLSKYALQSDVDAKIEAINLSPYANVADSVLKFPNGGRIWVG